MKDESGTRHPAHIGLGVILGVLASPFTLGPLILVLTGTAFEKHEYISPETLFLFAIFAFGAIAEFMAYRLITGRKSKSGGGLLPPAGYAVLGYGFLAGGVYAIYLSAVGGRNQLPATIAALSFALVCYLAYEQSRGGWTVPQLFRLIFNSLFSRLWRRRIIGFCGVAFLGTLSLYGFSEANQGLHTSVVGSFVSSQGTVAFGDSPRLYYFTVFLHLFSAAAAAWWAIIELRKLFLGFKGAHYSE